jgi:hypothetical protein
VNEEARAHGKGRAFWARHQDFPSIDVGLVDQGCFDAVGWGFGELFQLL